jgi:uncharacterized coiled-coil protein SlyX
MLTQERIKYQNALETLEHSLTEKDKTLENLREGIHERENDLKKAKSTIEQQNFETLTLTQESLKNQNTIEKLEYSLAEKDQMLENLKELYIELEIAKKRNARTSTTDSSKLKSRAGSQRS